MKRLSLWTGAVVALASALGAAGVARADVFTGSLYYTHFSGGGPNVLTQTFTYDSTTQLLSYGSQVGIATVTGADGIMFAPNGNLLVTSNAVGSVYRLDTSGTLLQTVSTGTPGTPDFHMALDPTGTKFYSSDRYTRTTGPLDTFAIHPDGSIASATTTPIVVAGAGAAVIPSNVTQLAFDPVSGKVFYTNGAPNCCGSVGEFTFGSPNDTTSDIFPGITAAHGILYDPFTKLMTMFGGGWVATFDPADPAGTLKEFDVPGVDDFDQGALDGFGHAFIAGSGAITFIDYSGSGDITSAANKTIITGGYGAIDDIAPLVGLGAPPPGVPEPGALALVGLGLFGATGMRRVRRRA